MAAEKAISLRPMGRKERNTMQHFAASPVAARSRRGTPSCTQTACLSTLTAHLEAAALHLPACVVLSPLLPASLSLNGL